MKRKAVFYIFIAVFIVSLAVLVISGLRFYGGSQNKTPYRIITDMDDKKIEIPADPRRIACMHGVSSERIVILGGADRLVLAMTSSPWMLKLYPEVKNLHSVEPPFTGNVEMLLNMKVDLVMYSPYPGEAEKYNAVGIKTACGFSPQKRPRNIAEYSDNFKKQITFFAELLGNDAKVRAHRYCKYFDEKILRLLSVTSKIPDKNRPKIYFGGRVGNPLLSQGNSSVIHWNIEIAGGNYLPQSMENNFVEVNMEQVLAWDPDIILLSGWCASADVVKNNPNWAHLRAVKNRKLYLLPQGVFTWDHASSESILLMIYMAKIFYPSHFKDWDMISEMKYFYSEIYGKKITDNDAERILKRLPPL